MKVYIKDLVAKQSVESEFLVKYIAVMEGKDGRNYLNLVLVDKSGEIEARKWTEAVETAEVVSRGDVVKVSGKVNLFQNRLQLIIKQIHRIECDDLSEFVNSSATPPEKMLDRLDEIVASLEDVYIRDLLTLILNDAEIRRRLKSWSAAKSIHHAYQSGLLEHTLSCTELALFLSERYQVNRSYVVAGTILHDLCKIYELSDGAVVEYTEEGKLVGHLVKSVELLDRFAYKIKNFPYQMRLHLKHILISHHGEIEFGSPKPPQTSEAMLVHLIDLMDSKMASFATIKQKDLLPGHWSGFVKHLDRLIYKEELPTYTEYIQEDGVEKNGASASKNIGKHSDEKPLKNSALADQLKGLQLKESE